MSKKGQFTVKILNPEGKNFPEVYNISEERNKYLSRLFRSKLVFHEHITDAIEDVSAECETIQELAFVCQAMGKANGMLYSRRHITGGLMEFLEKMLEEE